ncbi:phage holin family protein [Gracilimonas mengyeensis]|uniref:Holin-X, holin superfamily III n=1 Tax=Gracilimonas mengyeensis TaxID=1302730 RepID=A0A521E8H5_9BACT|nr:phage holin family protein [Gracilimonas mengyeensis]SMO80248.1 Putative Holin-X, holin superfamily III [Gracilimonas mengyeensis]
MDDFGRRIKNVTREFKEYIETRIELTMLDFGDKATRVIGKSIQQLAGYLILGIGIVFGMTALAIYLGEVLEERWAGYLIVSTPFLLLGLYLIFGKPKSIMNRIQEQILAEMLDSKEEEKDTDIMQEPATKSLPVHKNINKESEDHG